MTKPDLISSVPESTSSVLTWLDNLINITNRNAQKFKKDVEFRTYKCVLLYKGRVATLLISRARDIEWAQEGGEINIYKLISRSVLIDGEPISLEEADGLLVNDFKKLSAELFAMYDVIMGTE